MDEEAAPGLEDRVLLLAPTRRDAMAAGELFAREGIALTLCDDVAGICAEIERGAAVAIVPDEAVLKGWWDAFAAKGTVDVPLEKQMWGASFGQVTDPWGVAWMFNIESGEEPGAS